MPRPSSGELSIDELLLDLSDDTEFDESNFNQVVTPRTLPKVENHDVIEEQNLAEEEQAQGPASRMDGASTQRLRPLGQGTAEAEEGDPGAHNREAAAEEAEPPAPPTAEFVALKALVEYRPTEEVSPIQIVSQSTIGPEDPTPLQHMLPGPDLIIARQEAQEKEEEQEEIAAKAEELAGERQQDTGANIWDSDREAPAPATHQEPADLTKAARDLQELSSRSKAIFIAGGVLLAGGAVLALILV